MADKFGKILRPLDHVQEAHHNLPQLRNIVVSMRALKQVAAQEGHHLVGGILQHEHVRQNVLPVIAVHDSFLGIVDKLDFGQ